MYRWTRDSFDRKRADKVPGECDAPLDTVTRGIVAGTKVASGHGWRPVEAIAEGDKVLTFDGGMQTVVAVRRSVLWGDARSDYGTWPLHVPAGALGNRHDMSILADQPVLIESDTAEDLYGDPFALIPACALDGFRGISRTAPAPRVEVVTLVFEQDEIVFCNMGALFHCPVEGDLLEAAFADDGQGYAVLGMDAALHLVEALELEEDGATATEVGVHA